jgi:hypothetical protein
MAVPGSPGRVGPKLAAARLQDQVAIAAGGPAVERVRRVEGTPEVLGDHLGPEVGIVGRRVPVVAEVIEGGGEVAGGGSASCLLSRERCWGCRGDEGHQGGEEKMPGGSWGTGRKEYSRFVCATCANSAHLTKISGNLGEGGTPCLRSQGQFIVSRA